MKLILSQIPIWVITEPVIITGNSPKKRAVYSKQHLPSWLTSHSALQLVHLNRKELYFLQILSLLSVNLNKETSHVAGLP